MRWEPFEPRSPNAGAGHSADAAKRAISPGLEWRSWLTTGSQSRESFIPGPTSVDALAEVRDAAHPRDEALETHAEARVRKRPVLPHVEVPLERLERQVVLADAREQQVVVVDALRPADDLAVAFGREHVEAEGDVRVHRVGLHVEGLDRSRVPRDHDRRIEALGERRLLVAAQVIPELHRKRLLRSEERR